MKKVPCIKCDQEIWEYVRNYLVKWGYKVKYVSTYASWKRYPILVINEDGQLGECNNYTEPNEAKYDRELIIDVEEFLQRAAELKGLTYKRKNIMEINGIEIKPGMVIEVKEDSEVPTIFVVFPLKTKGLGVVQYGRSTKYPYGCWEQLVIFYKKNKNRIIKIRDLTDGGFLHGGRILWEKPKEVVISITELAKQYNCKPEQIKIVE